ncbi:WbqC-like protein family [Candidatus Magnetobacterium bavaricum]|uniref:WbqC-like protein family n=1 Tax=Candidatus Magnetobacterium bavaricum TaxID=29290 RepID=A0A0F3GJB4_9BACT|nr:WbqC-like protein family [Candidatus Magnetobacterium bavaricum]
MILVGHQPEYIPWISFFGKLTMADCFMIVDNVQFNKKYFQNRVRIRNANGWSWLTVPIITKNRFYQRINEVVIDSTTNWQRKHWKTISIAYKKASTYQDHSGFFEDIFNKNWTMLVDLNVEIIKYLIKAFGIKIEVIKSSDYPEITGSKTDLIIDMCKATGAKTYLSGIHGKDYIDEQKVNDSGIKLLYQEFTHPTYPQIFHPFIPNMSSVDLLFNCGAESYSILKESSKYYEFYK